MRNRLPMLLCSVAVGIVFAGLALTLLAGEARAKSAVLVVNDEMPQAFPAVKELSTLFTQMQGEDKLKVSTKTKKARIERIKNLVSKGELRNSADYFVGASVMAEGSTPEDALLTHDLALTALAMGDVRAKHLAAVGEDQFLVRIDRPQRYGTQTEVVKGRKVVSNCDSTVNNGMRHALGLPAARLAKQAVPDGPALAIAPQAKKTTPVEEGPAPTLQ
jgi:hypothetical protein